MIGGAPNCIKCKWFDSHTAAAIRCDAYPNGIPEDIIMGEPHNALRPDQVGDKVFEEVEDVPNQGFSKG